MTQKNKTRTYNMKMSDLRIFFLPILFELMEVLYFVYLSQIIGLIKLQILQYNV